MTERAQSASLVTRRGILILACAVGGTCASPPSLSSAPLSFRWPVPTRVSVTNFSERDTQSTVTHWTAHLFTTPKPGELKLRTEGLQLWDHQTGQGRRGPNDTYSELLSMAADEAPMTISTQGSFLGRPMTDEALARFEAILRSKAEPGADTTLLRQILTLLQSPEMRAQYEMVSGAEWGAWVGNWVGLDLAAGEEVHAKAPGSWGGVTIERDVTVRNQGPTRRGGPWVRYAQLTRIEGDDAREAMEGYIRGLARHVPGTMPPQDHFLRSVRQIAALNVVLDPATMRPNYAGSATEIEYEDSLGTHTSHRAEIYFFDWEPPIEAASNEDPIPAPGLAAYLENRLPEAYDTLLTAAEDGSRNPSTYAYLAETCRRLGEVGEAAYFARRALALAPCHAFAHEVLASCHNRQFSGWALADDDSTWTHLLRSIECDSTDGNAWLQVHTEARRRGHSALERRALARLIDTGFLPRPAMAYARWMVQDLPESTVLLTNGDMDSYPLWALQGTIGLRPDVAVVNYSLLGMPWYAQKTRDGLRVPLPLSDPEIDSLASAGVDSGSVSARIVRKWLDGKSPGAFRRPVAIALTVPPDAYPSGLSDRMTLVGPVFLCASTGHPSVIDTAAVRISLSHVKSEDFAGPVFADRDRSPVRRTAPRLSNNIIGLWLQYARWLSDAGRLPQSLEAIGRASEFAKATGAEAGVWKEIDKLRDGVRAARGRR